MRNTSYSFLHDEDMNLGRSHDLSRCFTPWQWWTWAPNLAPQHGGCCVYWAELCLLKIHVHLEPQNVVFLEIGSLQKSLVKMKST